LRVLCILTEVLINEYRIVSYRTVASETTVAKDGEIGRVFYARTGFGFCDSAVSYPGRGPTAANSILWALSAMCNV